jgi:hypothetical protein
MEERIEARVRARLEEEISAFLDALEAKLPDAEFRRVMEIAAKMDVEEEDDEY